MRQSSLRAYVTPTSLAEATRALYDYQGDMRVVAGATDLFAVDNEGLEAVLDIGRLELDYIAEDAATINIGAGTTFNAIIRSPLLEKQATALWASARLLADQSTRNTATLGGNLCSAVPSGDAIPAVQVLDAVLCIVGPQSERTVNANNFFTGPRQTVLQKGEILREIRIPKTPAGGSGFEKIARTSLDLAIANAAAWLAVDGKGAITAARVALGAVAPTVVRVPGLEAALLGQKGIPGTLGALSKHIFDVIAPIDNVRSTAEYRREISPVLARRALQTAYERAVHKS